MNGETDSNKDAPQSTNQSPLPSPMPPNAAPLGNKESNPSQTSGTETEELLRGTRTIEILQLSVNAALAVLGVIALCIYGGQLKVMRGQLNQMVQQLPEFQKSANAAEQSARVAKDTLVAINRPWVGIDSTPTVRQASERWYIGFSIKNFGLSPALHAVLSSGAENVNKAGERYCTVGEKLTTSGEDSSGPSGEQGYVLFPGKIAQLQTETAGVPNNPQNILYLTGCATYFDQFGKRPVHHTRFCYYTKTPLVADKPMFPCFAGWSAD